MLKINIQDIPIKRVCISLKKASQNHEKKASV